jgi:hypothetical protein
MKRRVSWGVVVVALAAALVPLPEGMVERWYSRGVYPPLQRVVTMVSNLVPFAVFDVLCVVAIVAVSLLSYRRVRRDGWARGLGGAGIVLVRAASVVYLVFLAMWGLNYRRLPIVQKVRFVPARVTPAAATALGDRNYLELNRLYRAAHERSVSMDVLASAVNDVQAALGGPGPFAPGRPKQTLLGGYFHEVAVAGMTDPFALETLISPDLLDVERPFVIAHEWAHLAGYADESEANFVAWLACMRAGDAARYSAWLVLSASIPKSQVPTRQNGVLDLGPRIDLYAMWYRYHRTNQTLRFAASQAYDKYLKANRVAAGVESYDLVVQLILGTDYDASGNPVLR